jgi:eukaryotic-like serine/threonine-protein kinase
VLYELLAGRHPFAAASLLDTAQGILESQAPPLSSANPEVPASLNSLVQRMLAKNPAERPTTDDVARAPDNPKESEGGFLRKIPAAVKWAVAALVLLIAGFAGWRLKQVWNVNKPPSLEQVTTLVPENRATAAAISPDGKLAAYANVDGIFLRTMQNGQTRTLLAPSDYLVDHLAWYADGSKLLASGFSPATNIPSIWVVSITNASPVLLRTRARAAIPSPDGTQVAFVTQDWSEIWLVRSNGEQPREVVHGNPRDKFPILFWSSDGRRLGFQRAYFNKERYEYQYESKDLATGKDVVLARNLLINSASALPDGRILFLRWDNDDFTSAHELWELKTDLATGALQGEPRKLANLPVNDTTHMLGLSVTANGQQAMALVRSAQNSVFVGDFDQSPPRITNIRRLTLDDQTNYPHAWTVDSRSVIFESNRNGNFDLFKQDIDRRTPETIIATPNTEMLPQLAPDGRFVLYAVRHPEKEQPWHYNPGSYTLMRVPIEGGTPQTVPIGGLLDEFRCALGAGKRCVLRTTVPGESRTYYDLDDIRGKGPELARIKWSVEVLGDWDISPDGSQIAIPIHDSGDARIRVVSLDTNPSEPREHDVTLAGVTDLRGLVWAADGQGWFVSMDTTIGKRLLYVYLDGRFHSLGDIEGWAVPSPDGRRVAFLNTIVATNAWLITLH